MTGQLHSLLLTDKHQRSSGYRFEVASNRALNWLLISSQGPGPGKRRGTRLAGPLSARETDFVLPLALASDTFSITVMEIVDNLIIVAIPGTMEAGLGDPLFSDQRSCHLHEAERKAECAQPFADVAFAPVVVARVSDDEDLCRGEVVQRVLDCEKRVLVSN